MDDEDIQIGTKEEIISFISKKKGPKDVTKPNKSSKKLYGKLYLKILFKLKNIIEEYTARIGDQIAVLIISRDNLDANYTVIGTNQLEKIFTKIKPIINRKLDLAFAYQSGKFTIQRKPSQFNLPKFVIDGKVKILENFSQSQLRSFIPLMLKYSTGRERPGWGKISLRPQWWPDTVPWENVKRDTRSVEEKNKVSWSCALRKIIENCYKYHDREDILYTLNKVDVHHQNPVHADILVIQKCTCNVYRIINLDGTLSSVHSDPDCCRTSHPYEHKS